jgi:tetratricopeptide (TPR) repeat protein
LGLFFFLFLFLEKQKTLIRTSILGGVAIVLAILAALQTQVWNNGVNLFKNCVAKTPESSLCQCNLAYNSLITNDFEGSVRHYSEALRYDPSTVEAYNGRGQAYLYLKRFPEALSDFDNAIQAGIVTPKLYLNKGKSLSNLKRFEEAIPALSRSLELEPKEPETWLLRAKAHQQLGNTAQALEDYGKALELEPKAVEARMNRAVILFALKQYDAAISDNTAALALAPEPAQVPILLNRANCYLMSGSPQKALEDANKALTINPQYTRGYQTRAAIWQALGQPAKMQEDLSKVKQ